MVCHEEMGRSRFMMARSAVDSHLTLHKSQSTPDFFGSFETLDSFEPSKSFLTLPGVESPALDINFDDSTFKASSLSFENDFLEEFNGVKESTRTKTAFATAAQPAPPQEPEESPLKPNKADKDKEKAKQRARRRTLGEKPKGWMVFKSTPDVRSTLREDVRPISREEFYKVKAAAVAQRDSADRDRTWSVSGSFPSFSRKSRGSTSRSPSPPPKRPSLGGEEETKLRRRSDSAGKPTKKKAGWSTVELVASDRPSVPKATTITTTISSVSTVSKPQVDTPAKKFSRAGAYLLRKPQVFVRGGSLEPDDSASCASSTTSLTQLAVDSRGSQPCSDTGDTSATDYGSASSSSDVTPRDPLWRVFKKLDMDFGKIRDSKTTNARMVVARNSLLPVLKQYASHPSNRGLKPTELEFRASVLDKWWNTLLDMLDGRATGHVAGVDRPQLLEITSMIMMRPEWRQSATYYLPLLERSPRERVKARARSWTSGSDGSSFDSFASSGAEFLAESAFHNVRTMFVANLVKQMVIVVDKVSLRNTPASLVNFAGKSCAYAFMFAPGVAEALVRIWNLSSDSIRRVADEFRLPRRSRGESDDIVSLFPLPLHSLGWTSVKTMSDALATPARLPLNVTKVNWQGPWMAKWKGRETDLFYIFLKYFYLLTDDFIPDGLPLVEKARAPAFVLVHAQVLTLLDNTVHRKSAFDAAMGPPFGESIQGADASLMAMTPFGTNNLLKGMGENRMIMLLRDFLGDHSAAASEPRQTFGEAFISLLEAATKRTSQYDHDACFTLCDILEEVLTAYSTLGMHEHDTARLVDWPFWINVCRRILDNHNSMAEIRVLSFLFSIWDAIAADPDVKQSICRDWLLSEPVFFKFFTHWSPMVRAYFMRLLCWRICRDPGRADDLDAQIFVLVSSRLKTVWSHYLWLKQKAGMEGKYPPSSAPCYPTPGKKFMIVRTEMPPTPLTGAAAPTTFDSFSNPLATPSGLGGPFSTAPDFSTETPSRAEQELPQGKKRWSLLSRVLTLSNNAPAARSTLDEDLDQVRRELSASRAASNRSSTPTLGPPPPPKPSYGTPATESSGSSSPAPAADSDYIFRFVLSWCPPNTMPPRERVLRTPRLPGPAQACVDNRLGNTSFSPAASKPMATRRYSGLSMTGLVADARNADPSSEIPDDSSVYSSRPSFADSRSSSFESFRGYFNDRPRINPDDVPCKPPTRDRLAQTKYSGKALAEWSIVVLECNGFVDRRRDEGVLGLAEVEVPSLGVEGFRRPL